MNKTSWVVMFFALAGALGALPRGGIEADAESGRLAGLGSWWEPAPDFEGRWWWREVGGGSAWVRAGAFQAGPLSVVPASEGWRTWGPGATLTSGHWGVGVDGGGWGFWAVQDPESLQGGVQGRLRTSSWLGALGFDRTWVLGLPVPVTGPWVDKARVGLEVDTAEGRIGLETTAVLPGAGPRGWWGRGRGRVTDGTWSAEAAGTGGTDPTSDRESWTAEAALGWRGWSAGWAGRYRYPEGAEKLGWKGSGFEGSVAWGPRVGTEGRIGVETQWAGVTSGVGATVGCDEKGWEARAKASVAGRFDRGLWSGSWAVAPGVEAPEQTLTAGWKEASFETDVRWKFEGLRLGWIGPWASFDLTVRWLF